MSKETRTHYSKVMADECDTDDIRRAVLHLLRDQNARETLAERDTLAAPDVAGGVEEACRHVNHGRHGHNCLPFLPTPPPQPAEREASTGAGSLGRANMAAARPAWMHVEPEASTGAPPEQDEAAVVSWQTEQAVASIVWETSRADEGTISATGANHVARAVLAALTARRIPGFGPSVGAGEVDRDGDRLVKVKRTDLQRAVNDLTEAGKDSHALYRLRDVLRTAE